MLLIFGFLWLSAILFALITSIRNASLLYRYVLLLLIMKTINKLPFKFIQFLLIKLLNI